MYQPIVGDGPNATIHHVLIISICAIMFDGLHVLGCSVNIVGVWSSGSATYVRFKLVREIHGGVRISHHSDEVRQE